VGVDHGNGSKAKMHSTGVTTIGVGRRPMVFNYVIVLKSHGVEGLKETS